MQNSALQVRGLQKSYKELRVLKGVDLEVDKDSILLYSLQRRFIFP